MKTLEAYIEQLSNYAGRQSKFLLNLYGLILAAFIGILDYLTGYEIQLIIFYLIPISLVTWFTDRRSGVLISIVSTIVIYMANTEAGKIFSHPLVGLWDELITLGLFLIFVFSLSLLKNTLGSYRALVENTSDMIYTVDKKGILIYANPTLEQTLGYGHGELLGKPLNGIVAPEYNEWIKNTFRRAMGGEFIPAYEIDLMRKDGTVLSVEFNISTLYDREGNPSGRQGIGRDITNRKRMEEALRKSEYEYRRIVATATEGIWIMDADFNLTHANQKIADMLGYTVEEMVGKPLVYFLFTEDLDDSQQRMEHRRQGMKEIFERRLQRKDGSECWTIISASPIIAEDGRFEGSFAMLTDITERKRMEEALRESERRLADIIEFLPDATFAIDLDGKVIAWNRAIEEMTGVKAESILGKGQYEYALPFYGVRRPILINLVFSPDEEIKRKYQFVRRDGDIIWGEANGPIKGKGTRILWGNARPLYDSKGNIAGAIESIRDITEQKRAEEAQIESRRRLSDIIEFLPDATLVIDRDGKVIAWNRAIEAMTEVKAEDMLGKGNYEYALPFYGERRPILIDLALNPDPEREKEYTAIRRTGDIIFGEAYTPNLPRGNIHLSATASVLRDSSGKIIAAIECFRNNTDRKNLEARLQQAQKMEAIGTLAGGIAHDFNNLLMAIQGNTSLMLMNTAHSDPRYEKLKAIEDQVIAGSGLTKQLLGFARVGKYELKPINLNEIVDRSSIMFGRTRKEILIHKKYEKALWAVEADTPQMEQILMNLYVNAWQAMPGGGHIYLETTNQAIGETDRRAFYMKAGRYVKISVADTGVGMDEKTKERIFEPFFTTKEMGRGTGLGLAMVYGIVKGHNGYINVYSEEGKGTVFNVYLPASGKEIMKEERPKEVILKGRETILLVDDERAIVEVTKEILEELGYQVLFAVNGREALKIYQENKDIIDLVILDMIMPDMGGGETFDRLKEINPIVKVILSSGYSINGEASGIMARGCRGFIQKPASVAVLSQKVREVLGGKA